jgi:hypothetical protein
LGSFENGTSTWGIAAIEVECREFDFKRDDESVFLSIRRAYVTYLTAYTTIVLPRSLTDNEIFGNSPTGTTDNSLQFLLRNNYFYSVRSGGAPGLFSSRPWLFLVQGFYGDDVSTQPIAVANQWYHVVWTLDEEDNRGIYVNGIQMYSGPSPGSVVGGWGRIVGKNSSRQEPISPR